MEKPNDCAICFEKLGDEKSLSCGHWLHLKCVQKHFKPECPLCRTKLNIKVSGKKPENGLLITDEPEEENNQMFEEEEEYEEEWEKKGYLYKEEDDEYDEENPNGDEWDYEDV